MLTEPRYNKLNQEVTFNENLLKIFTSKIYDKNEINSIIILIRVIPTLLFTDAANKSSMKENILKIIVSFMQEDIPELENKEIIVDESQTLIDMISKQKNLAVKDLLSKKILIDIVNIISDYRGFDLIQEAEEVLSNYKETHRKISADSTDRIRNALEFVNKLMAEEVLFDDPQATDIIPISSESYVKKGAELNIS